MSYIRPDLTWTSSNGVFAPLELRLKNAAGTVVASRSRATGKLELGGNPGSQLNPIGHVTAAEAATYTLEIVNTSSTTAVPSWSMPWSSTSVTSAPWTGSVDAHGGVAERTVTADDQGFVSADVSYAKGSHPVSATIPGTVGAGSTSTATIPADGTGTISASLDWSPTTQTFYEEQSVGGLAHIDRAVPVSANGDIHATLAWSNTLGIGGLTSNLALVLLDPSGNEVKRSDGTTNEETLTYTVGGITPPTTAGYTLRVVNQGPTAVSYTLRGDHPATAALDLELWGPTDTKVATATGAKPETLSYVVPSGATGTYSFKVVSKNGVAANYTIATTYPHLDFATLILEATDTAGNGVPGTGVMASTGRLVTDFLGQPGGTYVIKLSTATNAAVPVPSFNATVTTPAKRTANLDLELWSPSGSKVASTTSTSARPEALSYVVPAGATGDYTLKVVSRDHDADYTAQASFAHLDYPQVTAWLHPSGGGGPLASATSSTGTIALEHLTAQPTVYSVRLTNNATDLTAGYSATTDWPTARTTDLNLELWSPAGVRVALAANGSKPETLNYTVPSNATGNYILKVRSANYDAGWVVTESHQELSHATVTGRLKNSKGTVVAAATSSSGLLQFDYLSESTGSFTSHTLELQNSSTDIAAAGAALTATTPKRHYGSWQVELKDAAGATVASGSGGQILGLSAAVEPGDYTLVSTPSSGAGTLDMTATVPGKRKPVITYDANNHATGIDDGKTNIEETLSPHGRVLRRVVTDKASAAVVEDTLVGYGNSSDSPAYSRPTSAAAGAGAETTYLGDIVYTGTTGSWSLGNAHGDVVGTVDADGAFTAVPMADEYGVGVTPESRLGWLGGHKRFGVGGELGLVRMGVRLYDPKLGRFSSVDSVEGGSANDYEYCLGDPVNCTDLDGRKVTKWRRTRFTVVMTTRWGEGLETPLGISMPGPTPGVNMQFRRVRIIEERYVDGRRQLRVRLGIQYRQQQTFGMCPVCYRKTFKWVNLRGGLEWEKKWFSETDFPAAPPKPSSGGGGGSCPSYGFSPEMTPGGRC